MFVSPLEISERMVSSRSSNCSWLLMLIILAWLGVEVSHKEIIGATSASKVRKMFKLGSFLKFLNFILCLLVFFLLLVVV